MRLTFTVERNRGACASASPPVEGRGEIRLHRGSVGRHDPAPFVSEESELLKRSSVCVDAEWSLTVNPADTNRLEYGHEQQTHPAGGVRVKELEDVHPPLIGRDRCQFGARDEPPLNMSQCERVRLA